MIIYINALLIFLQLIQNSYQSYEIAYTCSPIQLIVKKLLNKTIFIVFAFGTLMVRIFLFDLNALDALKLLRITLINILLLHERNYNLLFVLISRYKT
jgi:hypothetical protein